MLQILPVHIKIFFIRKIFFNRMKEYNTAIMIGTAAMKPAIVLFKVTITRETAYRINAKVKMNLPYLRENFSLSGKLIESSAISVNLLRV